MGRVRVRVGVEVGWGGGGRWCVRRVGNIVVSFYLKMHGGIFTFLYSCKYLHCLYVCIFACLCLIQLWFYILD